jgi:hypothetical protein
MPVAAAIPPPLRAQVLFNVTRTDSVQENPATYYMVEKMAAITRVPFDGPPAEIALPHVLAQCDQPLINNMLFGNVCVSGGRLLEEMTRRGERFRIMRRKSEGKACGPH